MYSLVAKQMLANKPVVHAAKSFGGAVSPKIEKGRHRVVDNIIWLNVVPPDGIPRRAAAFNGESIMQALYKHHIPGLYAECQGGDSEFPAHQVPYEYYSAGVHCGQCKIEVHDGWLDKLNRMTSNERTVLDDTVDAQTANSRLACCVRVTKDLNESIIVVGNNRSNDSEFALGGGDSEWTNWQR